MVILIATRNGYDELKPIIFSGMYPVWVGADVLSQEEIDAIRELGVYLTNFCYSINVENFYEIEGAVNTINQHHPDERVWLEWLPPTE